MLNRFFNLAALVCVFITAALGQTSNQGVSYLFQMPGATAQNGGFVVALANSNNLNALATASGPVGMSAVIPKPDGSKFYLIGPGQIQSVDGAFATAPRVISGLVGPPTAAAITPDGKTLLVGAADGGGNAFLYLIDTNTDLITGTGGIPVPLPLNFQPGTNGFCPTCFITVSPDSKTAYVLGNSGIGGRAASVNLSSRQVTAQIILSGGATSIALSPRGLLYVTAVNAIYEMDPATLTFTANGTTQLFFTPYRIHFTPDGSTAYMVNLSPNSGGSLLQFTVATHTTAVWPPFQAGQAPAAFDDIIVAGNSRIFAFDSALQALADVSPSPFSATASTLEVGPNNSQLSIIGVAASNELPNAKSLFLLVANGNQTNLYRVDLATNTIGTFNQVAANIPVMQVATVPPQTGASSFLTFGNTNQNLPTGGTATALFAQVLDPSGLPVFNTPVSYTTDPNNGAVITNASTVTNANGYATATVKVPNTCGVYNVTLTAGAATQVFSITVPGNCNTGGNPNGPASQVLLVSGDGQIVIPGTIYATSANPLVVQVNDINGKPLANVPVTYTSDSGFLTNTTQITDANGLAGAGPPALGAYFTSIQTPPLASFQTSTITAATQFGSVQFTITAIPINIAGGAALPQFNIIQPSTDSDRTITVPQGSAVPNAIVVQILATAGLSAGQPIPGVGLLAVTPVEFTNPVDGTRPPPHANCQGSSNSDANGFAHCTLVATCQVGSFPLSVQIGGSPVLETALSFQLNVTAGVASQLSVIAGNNQSGVAGQTVSGLTASLTDGCNTAVPNASVVWTVKSGSATLVNTVNTTSGNGTVSTGVKFGSTPGQVVIQVATADGKISTTFTLTNSIIVSSVTAFSGSGQSALQGQPFGNPLVVLVKDNGGNPVSGINVSFVIASGTAQLGAASATTGSTGLAQVSITAGNTAGPVVVTATAAGFQVNFSLTVKTPGPSVTATSFVNAASLVAGLVPCGLGTVTGNGLATNVQGVISGISPFGPLPFTLQGFSMTINGFQAPIQAIANINGVQQVNYQTPCEVTPGNATVVVNANGAITTVNNVQALAAQPGIFTFAFTNGKSYAAIQRNADGSYVTPNNFAHRGETYYVYVTGLNQTTPALTTDSAGIPNQNVNLQTIVAVNGAGVPVVSAQAQQGEIGSYVIGFQIPLTAPTGADQPFAVGVIVNGQTVASLSTLIAGVQ